MAKREQTTQVCLGHISGAHGIKGDVQIHSYTENPMDVGSYGPVSDGVEGRLLTLRPKRVVKGKVIATVNGIFDRNAAESLRGVRLYISRSSLPPSGEGEFYCDDLIGLEVFTLEDVPAGEVISVQDYGAGTILEIRRPNGQMFLVPFTNSIVPKVDLCLGQMKIDPPLGLLNSEFDRSCKESS